MGRRLEESFRTGTGPESSGLTDQMIQHAMTACAGDESRARTMLESILQTQQQLVKEFSVSASQTGATASDKPSPAAALPTVFHLCDFDAQKTRTMLSDAVLCARLLGLAQRGCYYQRRKLLSVSSGNTAAA